MSRSSDIVHQIQQHRAERKKPKINAKLKKVSIDESQKGGIAAAQENKPPPITMQKTGGRNSLALTFSIGLHVGLALLLGFFYITQQLTSEVGDLVVAFVPQEPPQRERPINKPPPRPDFDPKLPEIEAPRQQPPVQNPGIRKPEGGFEIPLPSDTDLTTVEHGLDKGPKVKPIPGVKGPVQPTPTTIKPTVDRSTQEAPPPPDFKNTDTSTQGPIIDFPDDIDISQAGTSHPKPTKAPDPIYPEDAKRAGKEGIVKLQATVGTDGIPRNVVALTKIGFGFEEAAVEAMKKWRFIPGKKKGKETEMTVKLSIEFTLDD